MQANILPLPGRQLLEANIGFSALDQANPPVGPVTIFGFQVMDNQPQLGLQGVQARFEFRPENSITVFDPDTGQSTTIPNTELQPVILPVVRPLVLDVNTLTGAVSLRNPSNLPPNAPIEINYYEITSLGGSLDREGWVSIDDTELDPPGIAWEEAGGVDSSPCRIQFHRDVGVE